MTKFDIFKYNMILGAYKGFKVHYDGAVGLPPRTKEVYHKNKAEAEKRGVEKGDWKTLEKASWIIK